MRILVIAFLFASVSARAATLLVLTEPTARAYCGPVFDRWLAAITRSGWTVVVREIPRWGGSYLSNDWTSLNLQSNEVRRVNPDAVLKLGKTAPLFGGSHALDGHEVRCYENHSWLGCTNLTFTDATDFTSIMVGTVAGIATGLATNVPGDGKPDNMSGAFSIPVSTIDASGLTSAAGVFGSGYLIGQAYQPAINEAAALTNYLEACIAYHDGELTNTPTGHIASDSQWFNYATITATNLSVTWTVSAGSAVAGGRWRFVYDNCELQDLGPKWVTAEGVPAFIEWSTVYKSYQMENFNGVGAYRRRLFPGFVSQTLAMVSGWGVGVSGDAFWIATTGDASVADSIRSSVVRYSGGGTLTAPFDRMIIAGDLTLPVDAVTRARPSRAMVGTLTIP